MTILQHTRADDLAPPGTSGPGPADLSPLVGTWFNTNPDTRHIVKLIVHEHDGAFTVQAFGAGSPSLRDWGEVEAQPFVTGVSLREGVGFATFYDFGFMETRMVSNHSKGILVIQTYNTFKDGSQRANYFSREFFRVGGRFGAPVPLRLRR